MFAGYFFGFLPGVLPGNQIFFPAAGIYKTAAAANTAQYGSNVNTDRATESDIKTNFDIDKLVLEYTQTERL